MKVLELFYFLTLQSKKIGHNAQGHYIFQEEMPAKHWRNMLKQKALMSLLWNTKALHPLQEFVEKEKLPGGEISTPTPPTSAITQPKKGTDSMWKTFNWRALFPLHHNKIYSNSRWRLQQNRLKLLEGSSLCLNMSETTPSAFKGHALNQLCAKIALRTMFY